MKRPKTLVFISLLSLSYNTWASEAKSCYKIKDLSDNKHHIEICISTQGEVIKENWLKANIDVKWDQNHQLHSRYPGELLVTSPADKLGNNNKFIILQSSTGHELHRKINNIILSELNPIEFQGRYQPRIGIEKGMVKMGANKYEYYSEYSRNSNSLMRSPIILKSID